MYKQAITLNQIVEVAQQILHVRGYNAFSYANIAEEVGIKKASVHYYFPNKSDLVKEVVARHRKAFRGELARIDQQTADPVQKLELFVQHYADVLYNKDQMCLCGILAADFPTLPEDVRGEVRGFFTDNEIWLGQVLNEGHRLGIFKPNGSVELEAQLLLAGVEGAMLLARSFDEADRFRLIVQKILDGLQANK